MIASVIQHAQDSGSHARFMHLLRGFYTCSAAHTFIVWLLSLPRGLYTCRTAYTFTTRLLYFAAWLFNMGVGDPSRLP